MISIIQILKDSEFSFRIPNHYSYSQPVMASYGHGMKELLQLVAEQYHFLLRL